MKRRTQCSDCTSVDRREFVRMGSAALVGVAAGTLFDARFAHAAPTPGSPAETVVGELYASLSDKQKEVICLPFDHESRLKIHANWHVTEPRIGDGTFTKDQQAMINKIIQNVTSPDGYKQFTDQMLDDSGGVEDYSIAIFGVPGQGNFEWELTGRHVTLRADGNTVDKAAFGGPIIYGHGESDPKKNLFHHQTKKANEVFKALDADQAKLALLAEAPGENAVELQGKGKTYPGISVGSLTNDQKALFKSTLETILSPYRKDDVDEVMAILDAQGGLDACNMAFYREGDLENDQVWDIWRIEGPSLVCHFRGAPHVHAYINVGVKS